MSVNMSHSLHRRSRILEIKYEIQRMKVDLDCLESKLRSLEKQLMKKQHHLDRLQRRQTTRISEDEDDHD